MTSVSVTTEIGDASTTAVVTGEIDISNAKQFGSELDRAAADGDALVVDLGGVTYLDSSGIGELFALAARLTAQGRSMALVVPDGSRIRRLLEITQFGEAAPLCATRDVAARALALPTRES
jgi:anti-sigma B factor antagonist